MKLNSMYWTISTRQVQWTQAHFIDIPQEISTILDTTFDKTKHPQSQGERKKKAIRRTSKASTETIARDMHPTMLPVRLHALMCMLG